MILDANSFENGAGKLGDQDYWQQVEDLFHSALERKPDQRAAFLSEACASRPEILMRVKLLLDAHEEAGDFLQHPNSDIAPMLSKTTDPPSIIGQSLSRFKVISLLGKGGMGEVYLAEDTKLKRKVAIKSLPAGLLGDDRARKRLVREARAAAMLNHPNICPIYEIGEEGDHSFIVMQYVEGDTLSSKLQRKEVGLGESVDIAIQIAAALSSAHSSGIIHRDIKPQNIIITPRGEVKVLDFGLVKILPQDNESDDGRDSQALLTEAGIIVGTPAYMSPEQVKNTPLNASSDLFSLGALLYECVTSQPAFSGDSFMEVCAQVIHVNPPPPSRFNKFVPPELERIIFKALAKDTGKRYQSALEILTDLRKVIVALQTEPQFHRLPSVLPSGATQVKTSLPSPSFLQSNQLKTGLFVLLVVALALWAGFYLRRSSPHRPSPDAQRLYEIGKNALSDGAYYNASKILIRSVSLDDKFSLAYARLAEAWVEMDYPDKAKDELLIATSLIPDREALAQSDMLYINAITATVRRDFAGAVEYYRQLAELATGSQRAFAYVELGRAYQKNGEPDKALESYQQAITLDPQYAAAYLRSGILYGRRQELQKAGESFDKAETIYQALSSLEGVTEVLFQRGYLFNNLDKTADARAQLEKALGITQVTDSKHQRIKILLQLSSLSCTEGDVSRARLYADEAIDLAQTDHTEVLAADGMIDLGNSFFLRGEFAEAEKYFKQAAEFAQRSKSRRTEARGVLSLGSLLIQKGDVDEGLPYVEQALDFYRQGGYRKETSQALLLLGRGNRQKGDYNAAIEAFEQQLHLAEENGDQSQIASSHSSIGTLLGHYQERYAEALSHFEESYKLNNALGAKLNSGYDLMNRAGILWQLGIYQEARIAFNQAVATANNSDTSNKHLLALIYLWKSRMSLSEELLAEAGKNSQQAFDLADANYKDIAVQAQYTHGLARALSGMTRDGKSTCEEAVNRATSLRNPRLLSNAMLALAEAILLTGDWQNASATALQAQESFAQQGAKDSEWRSWLLAARAAERAGDRATANAHATRAAAALSSLQQELGQEYYKSYLSRPDIAGCRQHLDRILAANK